MSGHMEFEGYSRPTTGKYSARTIDLKKDGSGVSMYEFDGHVHLIYVGIDYHLKEGNRLREDEPEVMLLYGGVEQLKLMKKSIDSALEYLEKEK